MLSKTPGMPVHSTAPGVVPDTITGPVSNGSPVATHPYVAPAPAPASVKETRSDRSRRKAHRTRLHGYSIAAVALLVYLIRLAVANTGHVRVNWVFGTSHPSLVWLVLFAAILGWLLGLAATAAFRWRTRAPRRQHGAGS